MIRIDRATVVAGPATILAGASLEVPAGRALAVVGRSGAGKSTLLAAIATAIPLAEGEIEVHAMSVRRSAAAVRRLVGYLPGRPGGWPICRVGEFLDLSAAAAGLSGKPLRSAVARALDTAGLAGRRADPIDTLADGEGRMLLVARALLHDPQVLVFDDPFAGLDPRQRDTVERIVGDAHLMGRTVIAAIDDAAVPPCFTDLAVLAAGRITASGPADVTRLAAGRPLRYRLVCPARAEQAAAALRAAGVAATAPDLDQVVATIDPAVCPVARLIAAVVEAGLPVVAADFHPAWTAQLCD